MATQTRRRAPTEAERKVALTNAEWSFITDVDRRDIDYWYDQYLRKTHDLATIRQHAIVNKWHERRDAFWKTVNAETLKQQHVKLINERFQELADIQQIRTAVVEMMRPVKRPDGTLRLRWEPKSLGEIARVLVQMDDLTEAKREAILTAIDPLLQAAEQQAAATKQDEQQKLPLSRAEMRKVAHTLLAARRTKRRQELGIEDDDAEDDGGPQGPTEIEAEFETPDS
jgi:hypothetical protein